MGNRLRECRKASGLTQWDVADRVGIKRSRISMYELDKREPDKETICAFADLFNCSVAYLMCHEDKSPDFTVGELDIIRRYRSDRRFKSVIDALMEDEK